MFKELKGIMSRELKKNIRMTSHQVENVNKKVEIILKIIKEKFWDFPGGAVVKNLPANAGDTDLIPGLGRSHMPWSN